MIVVTIFSNRANIFDVAMTIQDLLAEERIGKISECCVSIFAQRIM